MTAQHVLVLGATGKVGRNVVTGLLDAGLAVRALARDPDRAALPPAVALHRGDVRDPGSVNAAADGADAAFLLWPGFSADGAAPLVDVLARRVRHVVQLSSGVIDPTADRATPGVWSDVEDLVRPRLSPATSCARAYSPATPWRGRRPSGPAAPSHPLPRGRPLVDPREGHRRRRRPRAARPRRAHAGRSHLLTGPAVLTQRERAAAIGEAIGRPVLVEQQSRAEAAADMAGWADPARVESALDHWANLVEHPEIALGTVEQLHRARRPAVRDLGARARRRLPRPGHAPIVMTGARRRGPAPASTAATIAAAPPTTRDSRAARLRLTGPGAGPSPRRGRSSVPCRYTVRPPSVTPSAPAAAASTGPALGLGCAAASRRHARTAARDEPPTAGAHAATSSAVTRAGTRLAASSSRAAAQPNRRYRGDRCPTMASSVLTAR